jgi:surfeit locus 1 family protein
VERGVWRVARRPKWIGALLLALAVAATLAALGQWQLERSFRAADAPDIDTETAVPLIELTEPQRGLTDDEAGRMVTVSGTLRADTAVVYTGRSGGGEQSVWLVARLDVDGEGALAVALGWAGSEEAALAAAPETDQQVSLTGRYLPGEGPQESDFEAGERSAISPAELVNLWEGVDAIYGGYLVVHDEWPGLSVLDSPPPDPPVEVNWLNLFYALEWAVFALFALFIWYRLVADEYELEQEELRERDEARSAAAVD